MAKLIKIIYIWEFLTPLEGVMSSDIADSPVMNKMDDNRALMIIRDASYKHILPLTSAYL